MTAPTVSIGASAVGSRIPLRCLAWWCLALIVTPAQAETADPLLSIVGRSYASQTLSAIVHRSAVVGSRRQRSPAAAVVSQAAASPSRRAPGGVAAYDEIIKRYSDEFDLDPDLVRAVIQAESSGDPQAVSPRGATGLMQLMPATASEFGSPELLDPEQNIATGTRYLRSLLDRYDSVEVALWAYNAGPGAVAAGSLPAETEIYVPRVLELRRYYRSQAGR
jgi:soluble lytic murein transglycosylase-like protein